MISPVSLGFMFITLFLSLAVPVLAMIIVSVRKKGSFGVWIAGALGFIVPQILIRIPVLNFLSGTNFYNDLASNNPYIFVFILALTAALFEACGRLVVLRVVFKNRLSYMTGFAAGLGHGGAESIVLVGLTYINNIIYSLLINSGRLDTVMPDTDMADGVKQAIASVSPELFLMAGFERVFTMAVHVILSLILAYFIFKGHTVIGFLLTVFIHFLMDFSVGVMQILKASSWTIQGAIAAFGVLGVIGIIYIRRLFRENRDIPEDESETAVREGY
jgi:uncharacterized membrane protein YhfC